MSFLERAILTEMTTELWLVYCCVWCGDMEGAARHNERCQQLYEVMIHGNDP